MSIRENCEYEKIIKYRQGLYDWMNEYDWEWFITMTLPDDNYENTEKYLKVWRQNLCISNHIRICYLGIIIMSQFTGNHLHLLMFGRNKDEDTLVDMDKSEWENEWSRITGRDCHIELVRDNGVIDYMTLPKNTPYNHFQFVNPYNGDFLEKYKKFN